MNRSGSVFLKVLLIIGIIIAIILIIAGLTLSQTLGVVAVAKEESAKIQQSSHLLAEQKDCSNLDDIKNSMQKIENKFSNACKNPIFKIAVKKIKAVPIKCETLPEFKADFEKEFNKAKSYCDATGKINESVANGSMSREELIALAQKYEIQA